jgi:hypothetical protein
MGEYFFGLHVGHMTAAADRIAARHGCAHVNFTEPRGERRGWFTCENFGSPFNEDRASGVLAEIKAAGGFARLTRKMK